ncbi:putative leucine-rich repeat receptor-like protein kinase [Hibiscus syriacus]|uniref:non-specific serine/threonine protein kinase n=1 Tax=Hibiscus syriacus TaxID=106335 RepID=A0A6A2WZA4_HIBSY|nr:putative leucine-rich repeat receptor-like protein kinase [Hibiscus syriacus]
MTMSLKLKFPKNWAPFHISQYDIYNNRLSGPFPDEIGILSFLTQLIAYSNNITGSLATSLCNLKRLKSFQARQNLLTGSLPSNFGSCKSFQYLGLAHNALTGSIPKGIGRLKNLRELILWGNQLSGLIPLVGRVPKELGSIINLSRLFLYRNQLNGTIPREIGNLSFAEQIDFLENSLTTEIPVEFSKIEGLQLLSLFENQLTGVIPVDLAFLKNLSKFDLSINYLTGPIPTGQSTYGKDPSTSLSKLEPDLSQLWINKLTGNILWINKLTGNIPSGVENCQSLVQLLLAGNSLTESFPSNLCKLVNLSAEGYHQNCLTAKCFNESISEGTDLRKVYLGLYHPYHALATWLQQLYWKRMPLWRSFWWLSPPSSSTPFVPDTKDKRIRLGKVMAIVAATIGGVSLIIITVIIYFMRSPVGMVPTAARVSDIYCSAREGLTFRNLVAATENFDERFVIGRGACGTVYKAFLPSGQAVAVKKLASQQEGNNNIDNSFRAEILTLGNIQHRNIVMIYGFCNHQGLNLLLYEYMSRGAQGIAYLHHDCKPRIFHSDIKSNNILLDEKFEAYVSDFGLAKIIV